MRRTSPDRPLAGTVVAVTGGARGIGLATARALVAAGAAVGIGDLDGDLAKEAAASLGGRTVGTDLDVTARASFAAFLDRVEAELGPLDALVNNAGIMPLGELVAEPDAVTRRILDVNLLGPLTGAKLAVERMAPRGRGHVVNVASGVGRVAMAGAATYSASKYGVIGLTEALRAELASAGIDVSCIVPMPVNTELADGLHALKGQRPVEPEEVAAAILGVLRRPRFETWVPERAGRLYRVMTLLPRSWGERISAATGTATLLSEPDRAARTAYEERVRAAAERG
jgi:NAD(P)-dependent dehydrogenase (short-subunit alcohol dehydrogenase family)